MDRRKSLQYISTLMGASFISTELFLTGCKPSTTTVGALESSQSLEFGTHASLLSEIGEIILPASGKHPGFKAVNGQDMVVSLLNDCYATDVQQLLYKGLEQLPAGQELSPAISAMDAAYFDANTPDDQKPVFYGALKEAILLSYFTNEEIMTKVLSYVKVPSKYEGDIKLDPNAYTTIYGFGA